MHWPKPDEQIEEAWGVMADLQREGKVRAGLASPAGVDPDGAHQEDRSHYLEPATLFHVEPRGGGNDSAILQEEQYWRDQLCPDAFRSIDWGHDRQSVLLTSRATIFAAMFTKIYQEPLLSRNLAVAEFIGKIGKRHNVSAGVVAIAWTLHHPAITAAIVGGRNAKQVEGVIPAATFRLSEEEFSEIQTYLTQNAI